MYVPHCSRKEGVAIVQYAESGAEGYGRVIILQLAYALYRYDSFR